MAIICLTLLSSVVFPCALMAANEIDLRLHVAWGGGANQAWQGSLRISEGTLEQPVSLGAEADDPATLDHDGSSVIRINQRSRSPYGGIDVVARGPRSAELILELAPTDRPASSKRFSIPIADLVSRPFQGELDDQKNRLLVSRTGGDRLRVHFERDSLVFAPEEKFEFELRPHLLSLEAGFSLRCRIQLAKARTEEVVWSEDRDAKVGDDGVIAPIGPIVVPLPAAEGVYDVVLSVAQRRLIDPINPVKAKPLFQRKVQLVVIDPKAPPNDNTAWKSIGDIDPLQGLNSGETADARWSDWLKRMPHMKMFSGFHHGPIGNGKASRKEVSGRTLVRLEKDGWLAYPLPIAKPDEPHILEIQYPTDLRHALGISIVEPNAAGKVMPIGLDSGVDIAVASTDSKLSRFRLVFWPKTKTPLVLLTNRRDDGPAEFGRLSVLAGPARLPPAPSVAEPNQRLLAAYFDKPLFPENFGAGEALDAPSQGTLDDWLTFYLGAKRLVEYLKYSGYNGAMVTVACEGSAIYPSDLLQPTPKYDNGVFFASGQDPVRKDVVEMLMRMFDREKLRFVPVLQFSTPLPELEALRRSGDPRMNGLELINAEGETWIGTHPTRRGLAPYYNPLNPSVRQAMRKVTTELAARYARHTSFAGVGLQLGPDTYLQLPGEDWGLDDATISRFEQENRVRLPGQGSARFADRAAALREQRNGAWLDWRASVMTELYRELQEIVAAQQPQAKLFLATADLLSDIHVQQALRPALPPTTQVSDSLLRIGLDPQRLANQPGVIVFRPNRVAPITNVAAQAVNLEASRSAELDRLFAVLPSPAAMHYHEVQPVRLESFDALSPFGAENTHASLMAHLTPGGVESRQRIAHAIAAIDPHSMIDGGWMMALGEEESVRSLLEIFRQLPAERFETIETSNRTSAQPLVVRRLSQADRTVIYVVNDSRRTINAEIELDQAAATSSVGIPRSVVPTMQRLGNAARWQLKLPPYDIQAISIAAPNVRVLGVRPLVDNSIPQELSQRLNEIRLRTNALNNPKPVPLLRNPGFELLQSSSTQTGWIHARGTDLNVATVAEEHYGGKTSLAISSRGPVAWVRSESFPVPASGRLALWVWLKIPDSTQQPPLRLAIEGRLDGQTYYRFATVGAGKNSVPLQNEWRQYRFQVSDLPVQGLTDLRIGFDLMGAGEVFVDDVQLYDLWFFNQERQELLKRIAAADFQLERGEVADCERFLDSFWPRLLMQQIPLESRLARNPAATPANPATPAAPNSEADAKARKPWMNSLLPKKLVPF